MRAMPPVISDPLYPYRGAPLHQRAKRLKLAREREDCFGLVSPFSPFPIYSHAPCVDMNAAPPPR